MHNAFVLRSAGGSQQSVVESLEGLLDLERLTVITGDFNVCLDKEPNNQITSFLCGLGFKQLVSKPTHKAGGKIDHAYIWDPNTEVDDSSMTQYCPYYSDHDALCLTLTTKTEDEEGDEEKLEDKNSEEEEGGEEKLEDKNSEEEEGGEEKLEDKNSEEEEGGEES